MHEKGIRLINHAMRTGTLVGPARDCPYFPCHHPLEDCTFCYCPFYPCQDPSTGGYWLLNKKTGEQVWACDKCTFPHGARAARLILDGLRALGTRIQDIPREKRLGLRRAILAQLAREAREARAGNST